MSIPKRLFELLDRLPALLLACWLLAVLSACNSLSSTDSEGGVGTADTQLDETNSAQKASPAEEQTISPQAVLDPAVQSLLHAAESALLVDQLTTPEYDNAYDRYQAVLLLNPQNQAAQDGIKQVQFRYLELAREAMRRNQYSQADSYTEIAKNIHTDSDLLAEIQREIQTQRQQYLKTRPAPPKETTFDGTELVFDTGALSRKEESIVSRLQQLAEQLRETDESLLIIARSDAEGRWIYKMMRDAVPDYRLRGNIQLGRIPKIQVLPPIE